MHDHVARTDTLILLVLALAILAAPGCAKLENITLGSYVVSFNVDESIVGNYEIVAKEPYVEEIIPSPDSEYSYLLTSYALEIINKTTHGSIDVQERNDVPGSIDWNNLLMSHAIRSAKHTGEMVVPGTSTINNKIVDICILADSDGTLHDVEAIYPLSDGEPQVCSIITIPHEWVSSIYETLNFEETGKSTVNDSDSLDLYSVLPKEHPGSSDPGYMAFPTGTYTYLLYWTGEIYRYPMVEAFETFGVSPDATPNSDYKIEFSELPRTIQHQMIKEAKWKWVMTPLERKAAAQKI